MASARAHINPDMLVWARKRVNATPEQIARRVGTSLDVVQQWEAGERRPTIKQLRTVAKYLERPVSHFYLDEPPEEPTPRIEMRRVFDGDPVSDSFDFAREVQRLVRRRQIALDLFERLGDEPPSLPEPRDEEEDPEEREERGGPGHATASPRRRSNHRFTAWLLTRPSAPCPNPRRHTKPTNTPIQPDT
jgi:transcriptional regulator with XRE-family HTH domain